MSDKKKKDTEKTEEVEVSTENSNDNNQENNEKVENQFGIDFKALSESEAKSMLQEVLQANSELGAENDKLKEESNKYKDNWVRTSADYENFKKRNSETRRQAYDDGKTEAIKQLLAIGDSLDRALAIDMDEKTKSGVELIRKQYTETMTALGVTEYDPVGEEFTPETCEAVAMVDAVEGEKANTIKSVYKKGYKLNGTKTLRYAQVIVIK